MPFAATSKVNGHWYKFIENLQAVPSEIYERIDGSLQKRNIPDSEGSRIAWTEAGSRKGSSLLLTHSGAFWQILARCPGRYAFSSLEPSTMS
jgi:hypothetical protein